MFNFWKLIFFGNRFFFFVYIYDFKVSGVVVVKIGFFVNVYVQFVGVMVSIVFQVVYIFFFVCFFKFFFLDVMYDYFLIG